MDWTSRRVRNMLRLWRRRGIGKAIKRRLARRRRHAPLVLED
jgi:hypothetical protein